jgi:hypothetical protein
MSRILEQIYVGYGTKPNPEPDPKPTEKKDPDSKKIIPDPQHC